MRVRLSPGPFNFSFMSSLLQRCLAAYWSSDFNDETIDSELRMKAVFYLLAQEITPEELCAQDHIGLYTEARALFFDALDGVV